ncbi:hypothetical protein T492DRAFT_878653 [Pavlovales sp. CCMP2436]|nr:hypothetical protein T492DRAFT_878653 [Pavlovales sp. CCMP2436]
MVAARDVADPAAGGGSHRPTASRAVGAARLCAGLPLAALLSLLSLLSLAPGALSAQPVAAATAAVSLGGAADFAILAKAAITSAAGASVTGNVGISPTTYAALVGFALSPVGANLNSPHAVSAQVAGLVYASDYASPTPAVLSAAIADMIAAYNDAKGRSSGQTGGIGLIGGQTFTTGVYRWNSYVTIASDITLVGTATDVFIFQIGNYLAVATAVTVKLVADGTGGGAPTASNIIWQMGGYFTIGANSHFEGIVLAKAYATFGALATMNGRVLTQTAITLGAGAAITAPAASSPPSPPPSPPPLPYCTRIPNQLTTSTYGPVWWASQLFASFNDRLVAIPDVSLPVQYTEAETSCGTDAIFGGMPCTIQNSRSYRTVLFPTLA